MSSLDMSNFIASLRIFLHPKKYNIIYALASIIECIHLRYKFIYILYRKYFSHLNITTFNDMYLIQKYSKSVRMCV